MKKLANVMMALSLSAVCAVSMSAAALAADFDNTQDISVMSREDGSGTRGAFIELFGIEQRDARRKQSRYDYRRSSNHQQHFRYDDFRSRR